MKSPRQCSFGILILSALVLLVTTTVIPQATKVSTPSEEGIVQTAWQLAQESGAYHFSTEIVQKTFPAPSLANVGRSGRLDTLYLEGQADLLQRTLQMSLWQNGGSALDPREGIEVRIEGKRAYGRQIGQPWQEIDDFSGSFAPDNDLMAYLAGATNVRKLAVEAFGTPYTRYAFDVDGPAFATYLRDRLEARLIETGELPLGLTLDVAQEHREITGEGEIWIDQRGLPLRLSVHLTYPPQPNGERVEADIQTDFSGFTPPTEIGGPLARFADRLDLPSTPRAWRQIGRQLALTLSLLGLLTILIINHRSKTVYIALVLTSVTAMVAGPLLRSQRVHAYTERQAAQRAEQERSQREAEARRALQEDVLANDWNPNLDPLANPESSDPAASPPAPAYRLPTDILESDPPASPAETADDDQDGLTLAQENVLGTSDQDPDCDNDGLTDSVEAHLGTHPLQVDSDDDGITDYVEVEGFTYLGRHWYLNPNHPDSNKDGEPDTFECPDLVASDAAPCLDTDDDGIPENCPQQSTVKDTDGDGSPDVFDPDNDGDSVADEIDLSTYQRSSTTTPYNDDHPFAFSVQHVTPDMPVFVDLQLRPVNADHLAYTLNVYDWPSGDEGGQIQRRTGNDSTFADFMSAKEIEAQPRSQNGDMRLVPMLEIEIPTHAGSSSPLAMTTPRTEVQLLGVDFITTTAGGGPTRQDWLSATVTLAQSGSDVTFDVQLTTPSVASVEVYAGACGALGTLVQSWGTTADGDSRTYAGANLTALADGAHALVLRQPGHAPACADLGDIPNGAYTGHMVDPHPLEPYGISVRDKDEAGTLAAYVPLHLVPDQTGGGNVAFFSRMLYWPESSGALGHDHTVRFAWLVQMLTDRCVPIPDNLSTVYTDTVEWCGYEETWQLDETRIVHTYEEEWVLTGLSVREDHGLDVAVAWEDPTTDNDLQADDRLWTLARGLNATFITGRDCDNDDPTDDPDQVPDQGICHSDNVRDIAIQDSAGNSTIRQRFDRNQNSGVPDEQRWNIPQNALRVRNFSYPHEDYVTQMMMNEIPQILTEFDSYRTNTHPTLLFAREETFRGVNLDVVTQTVGSSVAIDLQVDPQVRTVASLNWAPYRFRNGDWESYPITEYWEFMADQLEEGFEELLGPDASEEMVAGYAAFAEGFYVANFLGNTNVVRLGDRLTWVAGQADDYDLLIEFAQTVFDIKFSAALEIATEVALTAQETWSSARALAAAGSPQPSTFDQFIESVGKGLAEQKGSWSTLFQRQDFWGEMGRWGRVGMGLTVAVSVAAVAITIWAAAKASSPGEAIIIATNGLAVLLQLKCLVVAVKGFLESAAQVSRAAILNMKEFLSNAAEKGAIVGLICDTVITWGAFFITWGLSQMEPASMAWNALLASTIAATITVVILFAISVIPVVGEIVVAVIELVDAVVSAVCGAVLTDEPSDHWAAEWFCGGVNGLVTNAIAWTLYSGTVMVDMEAEDRFQLGNFDQRFVTPELGVSVGSEFRYVATVTNTIRLVSLPVDWRSAYTWTWWDDETLKTSTFDYRWQTDETDFHDELDRSTMTGDWQPTGEEHTVQIVEPLATRDGIPLTEPGINQPVEVYLSEGYAIPATECWTAACYIRTERATTHVHLGQRIQFDVFPATLDAFTAWTPKGNGYSFAWGQTGDLTFRTQPDFDGDELLSPASGGPDVDDAHADADNDGLWDAAEAEMGSRPNDVDSDDDGLSDAQEALLGTDPLRPDCDGDGLLDGQEVWHQDVLDFNHNGDTLEWLGGWTYVYGFDAGGAPLRVWVTSDPWLVDTDSDGMSDFQEQSAHLNPRVSTNRTIMRFESEVNEWDSGVYTATDGFVRDGDTLRYRATVENGLDEVYLQGLLSSRLVGPLSGDLPPETFVLEPHQRVTMRGDVTAQTGASGPARFTQVAGALQVDWQALSDHAALWLPFDEPVDATCFADRSGSMPPGNATCEETDQASCPTSGVSGMYGEALDFDGQADQVVVDKDYGTFDALTIAAWVRLDSLPVWPSQFVGLFGPQTAPATLGAAGNDLRFGRFTPGGSSVVAHDVLEAGRFYHVAATFDGTTMRVYLDGQEVASAPAARVTRGTIGQVIVGGIQNNRHDGLIDDVRVYRRALATGEIRALCTQPVFWMRFDEASATHFPDSSGFGNAGHCSLGECPLPGLGVSGLGASFLGAQYLSVDDDDSLDLSDGQFTIATWVYPLNRDDARYDGFTQGILGWYAGVASTDSETESDYRYPSLLRYGRRLRFGFGEGSDWFRLNTDEVLDIGEWNHVVVTSDGTTVAIYVDGVEVASAALEGRRPTAMHSLMAFQIGQVSQQALISQGRIEPTRDGSFRINLTGFPSVDEEWDYDDLTEGEVTSIAELQHRWVFRDLSLKIYHKHWFGDEQVGSGNVSYTRPSDPDFSIRLYEEECSDPCAIGPTYNSCVTCEGFNGSLDFNFFNPSIPFYGNVDETTIYRRALSPEEVDTLYHNRFTAQVHLRFDDPPGSTTFANAVDLTGLQDAFCAGEACPTAGVGGRLNQAALFDGATDAPYIGHGAVNERVNNFTIAAWIRPDDLSGVQRIVATARTHSDDGFAFGTAGTGLRFTTFGVRDYDATGVTLSPGVWTHVAAAMQADNSVAFYVNGQLVETVSGSAPANADTDDRLLIGATTVRGSATLAEPFAGMIDDVKIYRHAVPETDIQALFHAAPRFQLHLDEALPSCPFHAEYFDNPSLSGDPVFERCEDWPLALSAAGSPAPGVGEDDFSVRWTGRFDFEGGDHTFRAAGDNGVRVWLDGTRIIDQWHDGALQIYEATRHVSRGTHDVTMAYYHRSGPATASLAWDLFRDAAGNAPANPCGDNSDCPTPDQDGQIGRAAQFDGHSDYLTIPDVTALDAASFTASAWVRPGAAKSGSQVLLAKSNDTYGRRNYGLHIEPDGLTTTLSFQEGCGGSYQTVSSQQPLVQGQWNHVLGTYDGNTLRIYLNGRPQGSLDTSATPCQSGQPLHVGGGVSVGGQPAHFTGLLDEVTVYDHALTEYEIADVFGYQARWLEERQTHDIVVDSDEPTVDIRSVLTATRDYRPLGQQQFLAQAHDLTSVVDQVWLYADGEWHAASRCGPGEATAAWCPVVDFAAEGRYELRARAEDFFGHRITSDVYSIYVDGTPPDVGLSLSGGPPVAAVPHATMPNNWQVHLYGTLDDPPLPGGIAGSGVASDTLRITLRDARGVPAGAGAHIGAIGDGSWSVDYLLDDVDPSGTYTVTIEVEDRVGNRRQNEWLIDVDAVAPAATPDRASVPAGVVPGTATLQGSVTERPVPVTVEWVTDDGGGRQAGVTILCDGQTLHQAPPWSFPPTSATYTWQGRVHRAASCRVNLTDSAGDGGTSGTVRVCDTQVVAWDGAYGASRSVPFTADAATCGPDPAIAGVAGVDVAFVPSTEGSPFTNEIPPADQLLHLPLDNLLYSHFTRDVAGAGSNGSAAVGINGTCSGTHCPTFGSPGPVGDAARFDGVDDYFSLRRSEVNQLTNDFTLMGWIRPARLMGGAVSPQWIVVTTDQLPIPAGADGFGLAVAGYGLRFSALGQQNYDTSSVVLDQGEWSHVAAVMHPDNSVTFYVNGTAVETIAGIGPVVPHADAPLLVSIPGAQYPDLPFSGGLDDLRIFRRALSAEEIERIVHGSAPALLLPFDEPWATGGAQLTDDSGRGTRATLYTRGSQPDAANKAVTGRVGAHALAFDGADDFVGVGHWSRANAAVDLSHGRFSQALWVYPTPEHDGTYPILNSALYTPDADWYPFLNLVDRTHLSAGFGDGSTLDVFTTGSILTEGTWNHVVATFDGATYRIYVDGVERAATDQFAGRTPHPTRRFDVGQGRDAGSANTCATIDLTALTPGGEWTQSFRILFDATSGFITGDWPVPGDPIPLDEAFFFCGSVELEVQRAEISGSTVQWLSLGTHVVSPMPGLGQHAFSDGTASAALEWDVTPDPEHLLYFKGHLDDLRIYPRALAPLEIQVLYRTAWQPAAVAQTGLGVERSNWTAAPPAGLEGIFELDLRGADVDGHVDIVGQDPNAWRGPVDSLAPRVVMTRETVGANYRYTVQAEDFNLTEDGLETPCGTGAAISRQTFQSPWYLALAGETAADSSQLSRLTATCETPIALTWRHAVTSCSTAAYPHAIAISGTHAYVASDGGLEIVDIADPAHPSVTGAYSIFGAIDVKLAGRYAYVPDNGTTLHILDVSDPQNPQSAGGFTSQGPEAVAVSGTTAYLSSSFWGLQVLDVSDPANVQEEYNQPLTFKDLTISGDYLYALETFPDRLVVLDISQSPTFTIASTYTLPASGSSVAVSGTVAYVADGSAGLRMIDVSDPISPAEIGAFSLPGWSASDVVVSGTHAYVAAGTEGVWRIDVSDPAAPQALLASADWSTQAAYRVLGVAGPYAYVAQESGGLAVIDFSLALERATACDRAGNCTTVPVTPVVRRGGAVDPAPRQVAAEPPLGVSILNVPPVLDSLDAAAFVGRATAATSSLQALTVTLDSAPIYTETWAADAVTETLWTAHWTPAGEGRHVVTAQITAWDGGTASDAVTFTLDTAPPAIGIAPGVLTTTHLVAPRLLGLTGWVTDSGSVPSVRATVDGTTFDGGVDATDAPPLITGDWRALWDVASEALPDGATFTVTAQATDAGEHTAATTETLTVDIARPSPVTMSLHSGAALAPGDTLRQVAATLTVSWTAASDGSGIASYGVDWADTDALTTTHILTSVLDPRIAQYAAADGHKIVPSVTSRDGYGNDRSHRFGPVYVDSPLTPDYALLDDPDGVHHGWMESACSRVGVDRRVELHAPHGAALEGAQAFYVTWDAAALRMAWSGANWNTDGDLFVYLDTIGGGADRAFSPYLETITDTIVHLPAGMAADHLVWVRDDATALLLTWNGSSWDVTGGGALSAEHYRFDPAANEGQTDLYLPFDRLGISDPATQPLDIVAFASEEGVLRLWATAPAANPVSSPCAGGQVQEEVALARHYHWDQLGSGVCPNGSTNPTAPQYPDAGLEIVVSAAPPGDVHPGAAVPWIADTTTITAPLGLPTAGYPPVGDGQIISYTIHYRNPGSEMATDAWLAFSSPYGLSLIGGNSIDLGDVDPGGSGTRTFQASVSGPSTEEDRAALLVRSYDADRTPAGAPLDWSLVEHGVDVAAPESLSVDQPVDWIGTGDTLAAGRVLDASGVPLVALEIEPPAGSTVPLACPDATPDDGRWACMWDVTASSGGVTPAHGATFDVRAQATDGLGQVSAWTAVHTVRVDAAPPTITLDLSATEAISGALVSDSAVNLVGDVLDDAGVRNVDVCVDDACGPATLQLSDPRTGQWSYRTPGGAALDHVTQQVSIYGEDVFGNRTVDPLSLDIVVDNVAPVVTVTHALASSPVTSTIRVLEGLATDGGEVGSIFVTVQSPTGRVTLDLAPQDGDTWHYDLQPTVEGRHVLWISACDGAGNVAAAGPFTVEVREPIVYLPLVSRHYTPGPDLVVERLFGRTDFIEIVIRNQGDEPVTEDFWVDLYIDPDTPPTEVNQTWPQLGDAGMIWGVEGDALPLEPGETLTLLPGDVYYWGEDSWPGGWPLPAGIPIYAQVDSANRDTTYGGVLEGHERTRGGYNNIAGPVTVVGEEDVSGGRFAGSLAR
jgi:hypothetical protein